VNEGKSSHFWRYGGSSERGTPRFLAKTFNNSHFQKNFQMGYNQDFRDFAQVLRSRGYTVKQIVDRLHVSRSWVHDNTENTKGPHYTEEDLISLVRDLVFKTSLAATKDNCQNPKEFAWPLTQYASVLKTLIDVSDQVTARAAIEAAKNDILMLKESKVKGKKQTFDDAIELLQASYDALVEEL
jgi:hypothetical protein